MINQMFLSLEMTSIQNIEQTYNTKDRKTMTQFSKRIGRKHRLI